MKDKYELISDVSFIQQEDLFQNSYYLLGSESLNSYIKMKYHTYEYAKALIELLRQNKDQKEIHEAISQLYPDKAVDMNSFFEKLKQAGLIKGFDKMLDDEMGTLGISVFERKFDADVKFPSRFIRYLYSFFAKAYIWLPVLAVMVLLTVVVLKDGKNFQRNETVGNFMMDTVVTLLLTGFCFLFHEFGHAVAAINHKVKIKTFSFGLYLGIIPTFYFSYYNLKIAPSKTKLKIVIAGVYVNLILSGLSYVLSAVPWNSAVISQVLYTFAVLNFVMLIGNLFPTRLSDGYYITSLLFNKFDIRISFWQNIFYFQREKSKLRFSLLLYSCVIIGAIVHTVVFIISKAVSYIHGGSGLYGYSLLAAVTLMLTGTVLNVFIKLKGVKSMLWNIIRQRMKIRNHRKNNFAVTLVITMLILIVTAGISVYQNAKTHALDSYWDKAGSADVIAVFSGDSVEKADSLLSGSREITYAYGENAEKSVRKENTAVTAIVAYANLSDVNRQFHLNLEVDPTEVQLLLNSELMGKLSCEIGDEVVVEGRSYTVGAVSNKINFLAARQPIAVIHMEEPIRNAHDGFVIAFADYGHDQEEVTKAADALSDDGVSFMNQLEGSQSIEKEFANLQSILSILSVSVMVICLLLIYTSFSLNLKNNLSYWSILRTMGLTNRRMLRILLAENMIFSFLGSLLGYGLGILAAYAVCLLTDTNFTSVFLSFRNSTAVVFLGCMTSLVPTFAVLSGHLHSAPLDMGKIRKRSRIHNRAVSTLSFVVGILLILGTVAINPAGRAGGSYYAAKMIMGILAILLVSASAMKKMVDLSGKARIKIVKLSSYLSRIHASHVTGISISLVMCLVMLGTLLDFSYSFKMWARELADGQLAFDVRATASNNHLGTEQISSFLSDSGITPVGEYYLDIGKIAGRSSYLIAEPQVSEGALQKIYRNEILFHTLKENEAAVTSRLLKDLNLRIGDTVEISLNGVEKTVKIVSSFETQDYSSYLAAVSADLFEHSDYKNYCVNAKTESSLSISDLRKNYDPNFITFSSRDELAAQWENAAVSGVDIIFSIAVLIVISLLLMLRNSIKNSILDRRKDFSILRTMGASKKEVLLLLFTELSLFQVPTVVLSIAFSPLIAYYFVQLNAYQVGYQVDYRFDLWSHVVIWAVLAVIIPAIPIRMFLQAREESPIDSIKSL
ncbi:MAG: M50 family metallopeptidase [Clostridium sp.]|jgi:putative ABC transport system permease protein|nr:M50 family metallopeptidase [Clostridium sp.]